jgi:hypothetical protein
MCSHFSSHRGDGQKPPASVTFTNPTPQASCSTRRGETREMAQMRLGWMSVPWVIVLLTALLWFWSFYQLTFIFWPALIETVATEESGSWYWYLFRPYLNIYLFAPFVIGATLIYIFVAWILRRAKTSS